jgi:hypothetical protein
MTEAARPLTSSARSLDTMTSTSLPPYGSFSGCCGPGTKTSETVAWPPRTLLPVGGIEANRCEEAAQQPVTHGRSNDGARPQLSLRLHDTVSAPHDKGRRLRVKCTCERRHYSHRNASAPGVGAAASSWSRAAAWRRKRRQRTDLVTALRHHGENQDADADGTHDRHLPVAVHLVGKCSENSARHHNR